MSQSIEAGSVLGGRYKVTGEVLASADGDVVLDGVDQVLNRPVSILVASSANASQVATSAREIATGERYAAMQVLDLGISEGTTYLITNTAEPADLLDLVITSEAPFIEPFQTDTLGSEIFGESRSREPHVYEDDDEYYEELRAQEENRPRVMDRLESGLSDRLSDIKSRFGNRRTGQAGAGVAAGAGLAAGAAAARAGRDQRDGAASSRAREEAAYTEPTADQDFGQPGTGPATAEGQDVDTSQQQAVEPAPTRAQPVAPEPEARERKVFLYDEAEEAPEPAASRGEDAGYSRPASRFPAAARNYGEDREAAAAERGPSLEEREERQREEHRQREERPRRDGRGRAAGAAGAAGAAAAGGAALGAAAASSGGAAAGGAAPATGGAGAASAAAARPASTPASAAAPSAHYADADEPADGSRKATRLIAGAVLALLLVVAVVIAFMNLLPDDNPPVAGGSPSPSAPASSGAPQSSGSSEPSEPVVEPQVAGIYRLVPGNQELNAETDSTLGAAIDGNPSSIYRTYSYTRPDFGGFASNMVLVVELEEVADVSSIEMTGLNGSGGAFEIRVGETNDLASAQEVSSGSFTGPTVTVPVTGDEPVKGQYVFINVTELPQQANPANESRPYGLQVADITVN